MDRPSETRPEWLEDRTVEQHVETGLNVPALAPVTTPQPKTIQVLTKLPMATQKLSGVEVQLQSGHRFSMRQTRKENFGARTVRRVLPPTVPIRSKLQTNHALGPRHWGRYFNEYRPGCVTVLGKTISSFISYYPNMGFDPRAIHGIRKEVHYFKLNISAVIAR